MLNLTPTEIERLLIFQAAELARRRRQRGLRLNQAEAEALLCDEALEMARDGMTLSQIRTELPKLLTTDDVLDGVASLVTMIAVEGLFADGTRLITVLDPIGPAPDGPIGDEATSIDTDPLGAPGEIICVDGDIEINAGRAAKHITIANPGDRPIFLTSHWHLAECNAALLLDRTAAFGHRLDVPAGTMVRVDPGSTIVVSIVPIGGNRIVSGHRGLTNGPLDDPDVRRRAIERIESAGGEKP
ncbi:MAG: urease subunit beta [Acidimicrobiia bacterium]